jgi:hypothetical protein
VAKKCIMEITIVSFSISLCLAGAAHGQSGPPPDKQAAFLVELSGWVRDALATTDPDKARYVLRRTGCSIDLITGKNKKTEFLPIADQTRKCARQIANFDCRATLSLVKDASVAENKYYDFCKSK